MVFETPSAMKKYLLLPWLLFAGCRGNDVPAVGTFRAVVWAEKDLNCGTPVLDFDGPADEVERVTGTDQVRFNAIALEPRYARSGQRLRVRVRKPFPNERMACITLGPSHAEVVVLSADPE